MLVNVWPKARAWLATEGQESQWPLGGAKFVCLHRVRDWASNEDMPLGDNPFAVLTTVVAPAVLTNACSVLALGTSNRVARVVDQSRVIAAEIKSHAPGSKESARCKQQFGVLRRRAKHLLWALRLFYASLGSFACAVLIAVAGGVVTATSFSEAFTITAIIGFAVGAVGVGGLTIGCALMVVEVRLALKQTADDTDAVLNRP